MNDLLSQFIDISKYAGMREDLIQAGGGNTSVKLERNKMLIKSSGVQLADINETNGYSTVNTEIIIDFFYKAEENSNDPNIENVLLDKALINGMRPSIETFLHAITDVFTLHTHPVLVNVLTCRENGMNVLKELFPAAVFIDYATPGIQLAKKYFKIFEENRKEHQNGFDLVFLKNHGVIVSGKSAQEVIRQMEAVLFKIEEYLKVNFEQYHDLTELYQYFKSIRLINSEAILYLSKNIDIYTAVNTFENGVWEYAFCPDCLVYCGKKALVLSDEINRQSVQEYILQYGNPVIILYKNSIYIIANSVKKAREIESVLSFSAQVAFFNLNYNMDLLENKEQDFLLNWDSEKYRKSLK